MGEAKRRRDLGLPPRTLRCPMPACRSANVFVAGPKSRISATLANAWGGVAPTTHGICKRCNAIWEVVPSTWRDDTVERCSVMGPCDNCAFRATSRETADPEERARIHAMAEECAAAWESGDVDRMNRAPRFACHKGIPIKVAPAAGSIAYDFEAAGIKPNDQLCAGFMRIMWAKNGANAARRERERDDGVPPA